jgi:hypothetical protein
MAGDCYLSNSNDYHVARFTPLSVKLRYSLCSLTQSNTFVIMERDILGGCSLLLSGVSLSSEMEY